MTVNRADFPLLAASPGLHYLDSAATSQKPQVVIDELSEFYSSSNANVARTGNTVPAGRFIAAAGRL